MGGGHPIFKSIFFLQAKHWRGGGAGPFDEVFGCLSKVHEQTPKPTHTTGNIAINVPEKVGVKYDVEAFISKLSSQAEKRVQELIVDLKAVVWCHAVLINQGAEGCWFLEVTILNLTGDMAIRFFHYPVVVVLMIMHCPVCVFIVLIEAVFLLQSISCFITILLLCRGSSICHGTGIFDRGGVGRVLPLPPSRLGGRADPARSLNARHKMRIGKLIDVILHAISFFFVFPTNRTRYKYKWHN